jgi:hypothetical protein
MPNTAPIGFAYADMELNGTNLINVPTTGADKGVGIGAGVAAETALEIGGTYPTSGGNTFLVQANGTSPAATTGTLRSFSSTPNTAAGSYTLSGIQHFRVEQGTFGAGSTVTNQYGFLVQSGMTGATNNYAFFADLASGSGRFNFYAGGDAVNYFAGNLGIGTTSPAAKLDVVGASAGSTVATFTSNETGSTTSLAVFQRFGGAVAAAVKYNASNSPLTIDFGTTTNHGLTFLTNNAERARITAAGSFVAGASAALTTTATDGFLYVPTCAGTPTGTPTAITGMAPIVVDTTNNKMYFYSGGQWRDAGP